MWRVWYAVLAVLLAGQIGVAQESTGGASGTQAGETRTGETEVGGARAGEAQTRGTRASPEGDAEAVAAPPGLTPVPRRPSEEVRLEGPTVEPEPPAGFPRSKRVLVFTGIPGCRDCLKLPRVFRELQRAGWRVGEAHGNHFQPVDLQRNPGWDERYNVPAVPCWVLLETPPGQAEREVARMYAYQPAALVIRFWQGAYRPGDTLLPRDDPVAVGSGPAAETGVYTELSRWLAPGRFVLPLADRIDRGHLRVLGGVAAGEIRREGAAWIVVLDRPLNVSYPPLSALVSAGITRVEIGATETVAVSQRGRRYRVWVEPVDPDE